MFTHTGNQSLQYADPWQEHFALDQTSPSQIKEDREALFAPPGASIEPAEKAKVFWLGSKIVIAVLLHDFVDMIVAHLTLAVAGENRRISNVELGSERQDDAMRNIGRIGQESAQEPDRTKLKSEAQACMIVTTRSEQTTVTIVKMKVESKLLCGWLPYIAAVALALFWSKKFDGHRFALPFPQVLANNLYIGL